MEKLSKYNITFIVSAVSSLAIISMCAYMILDIPTYIMRALMLIEFLCSFYFVCVFFYKLNKYYFFPEYILITKLGSSFSNIPYQIDFLLFSVLLLIAIFINLLYVSLAF